MLDLVLAIAHHLLVFGLAAILAMEVVLVRAGMTGDQAGRVARLDGSYGGLAGLVLVVGLLRVFLGAKGAGFYMPNPMFWAKISTFALVGILSLPPTLRFLAWRRNLRADPGFVPPPADIAGVRRFLLAEAVAFAFIPVFAAWMARWYGV